MKVNSFSAKCFFAKRIVFLSLLAVSMSTVFVACEKELPNENDDDEGVYYKRLDANKIYRVNYDRVCYKEVADRQIVNNEND